MQTKSGQFSLITSLLLVLFISGCVNLGIVGPTSLSGSGVKILAFEPEIRSAYSGESVDFQLKIKNMGSFEADNIEVDIDISEWKCSISTGSSQSFSLIAPSDDMGTEGEEKIITWSCKAPTIAEGMNIPYEARVEVGYKYRTITSKTVTILPTSELIALENAGKALPSETLSQSDSPVMVEVQVKGPIRVRKVGGMSDVEFPVTIKISNIGGGIVQNNEVNLGVEGVGGLRHSDCDHSRLPLWKGQSQTITCKMTTGSVNTLTQARIVATLEYDYLISSAANIEVIGASSGQWV